MVLTLVTDRPSGRGWLRGSILGRELERAIPDRTGVLGWWVGHSDPVLINILPIVARAQAQDDHQHLSAGNLQSTGPAMPRLAKRVSRKARPAVLIGINGQLSTGRQ